MKSIQKHALGVLSSISTVFMFLVLFKSATTSAKNVYFVKLEAGENFLTFPDRKQKETADLFLYVFHF